MRDANIESDNTELLLATTTAAERMAMVTELTRQAWAVANRPWPDYERADMPVRVLRAEEP